jgi:hypothetical protein
MSKSRWFLLTLLTLGALGFTWWDAGERTPESAPLPEWVQGEFAASSAKYAGRTVTVDSASLRFSRGAEPPDIVPVLWIEAIADARPHIRIFDLHIQDADRPSTIRLIASQIDSSFRLQTMPDVAWRRERSRAEIVARATQERAAQTATDSGTSTRHDSSSRLAPTPAVTASAADRIAPRAPTDTVIRQQRFVDQDPVALEELRQVVEACRRNGCRIGIRGLAPARHAEFSARLQALGADSVVLTATSSDGAPLTMLDILPPARR